MKKRIALPTAKTIQIAVLVAASTGLIREAYTPYPDMQPNPQYKETVYKKWAEIVYVRPSHNQYHKASDWRKQQIQATLDKINTIRGQIRTKAAEQLIENCAKALVEVSNRKAHQHVENRAAQLHVKPSAIKSDILRGMRMVSVDMESIVTIDAMQQEIAITKGWNKLSKALDEVAIANTLA